MPSNKEYLDFVLEPLYEGAKSLLIIMRFIYPMSEEQDDELG